MQKYRLRLERKRRRARSLRKRRELSLVQDRRAQIGKDDILAFATIRNEKPRLEYFLSYYRAMGVQHFCFVDNGSTDGTQEFLADQNDVSVWYTERSYKRAGFGMDWLNGLMSACAVGHWCLVVDVDEFFVYPHCDTRPLRALTDWLDYSSSRSFGTLLIDTYPKGHIASAKCEEGQNPLEVTSYFDSGNYSVDRNKKYGNLWIQGGARERSFFRKRPAYAPALNKIPLVKWERGNVFVSSTHNLLPRGLNIVYEQNGGERTSGALMHTKFLDSFMTKAKEEVDRHEHYAASREYLPYADGSITSLWTEFSQKYQDWRQLEKLGLISTGDWV